MSTTFQCQVDGCSRVSQNSLYHDGCTHKRGYLICNEDFTTMTKVNALEPENRLFTCLACNKSFSDYRYTSLSSSSASSESDNRCENRVCCVFHFVWIGTAVTVIVLAATGKL